MKSLPTVMACFVYQSSSISLLSNFVSLIPVCKFVSELLPGYPCPFLAGARLPIIQSFDKVISTFDARISGGDTNQYIC